MTLRSHTLKVGKTYTVKSGIFQGDPVEILDNITVPDGQPNQRKILVKHYEGPMYILPRQIDAESGVDTPVAALAAAAPTVQLIDEVTIAPVAVPQGEPMMVVVKSATTPLIDPMDPRLDKFRPSRSRIASYIKRTMPNGLSDIDFLLSFTDDEYRTENQGRPANIMLKGDTQSGKTMLTEMLAIAWADKLGYPKPMPVFTLSGSNGITDFDLFGQPTTYTDPVTGVDRLVFIHGVADLAARCGGILFIDEANAINERTTTSIHPLADHRHQFTNRAKAVEDGGLYFPEVVNGHLDLWIIGNYNDGGYRGMSDMNEAFLNRFRHLTWGYNEKVEEAIVPSAAIRHLGELLRTARTKGVLRTPVGTSALQRAALDVRKFGPEMAMGIFLGLFKAQERLQVEDIINDKAILVLLNEELKANA